MKMRNLKRRTFRRNKTKVVRGGDVLDGYVEIKGWGIGNLRTDVKIYDGYPDDTNIMLVSKNTGTTKQFTIGKLKKRYPKDYKNQLSIQQPYYHIYVKEPSTK